MIELVLARLDERMDAVRATSAWLSDEERRKASRLRSPRERRRFAVARARLRQLLAARLGEPPEALEFVSGSNGKPVLGPRFAASGWHFNVAHCGDVALYALARGSEVGVDLEALRAIPEADAIAAGFFSPRERDTYRALRPQDRPLAFLNCWTRKEAFVKALGAGLSMPLDQFDVSLAPGEPAAVLRVGALAGDAGWCLQGFSPLPGFIAAVASRSA